MIESNVSGAGYQFSNVITPAWHYGVIRNNPARSAPTRSESAIPRLVRQPEFRTTQASGNTLIHV
jgi:hypothetical protein